MSVRVRRCLLCGDATIDAYVEGHFVTTSCPGCHAVLIIEFEPPDEPTLRARIERIDEATDGGFFASNLDTRTGRRFGNQTNRITRVASRPRRRCVGN